MIAVFRLADLVEAPIKPSSGRRRGRCPETAMCLKPNTAAQERDDNTAKLKEQRLNKEAIDHETAAAAPPKPKAKTRVIP